MQIIIVNGMATDDRVKIQEEIESLLEMIAKLYDGEIQRHIGELFQMIFVEVMSPEKKRVIKEKKIDSLLEMIPYDGEIVLHIIEKVLDGVKHPIDTLHLINGCIADEKENIEKLAEIHGDDERLRAEITKIVVSQNYSRHDRWSHFSYQYFMYFSSAALMNASIKIE